MYEIGVMQTDLELDAMMKVVEALAQLEEPARERVLKYALARFKPAGSGGAREENEEVSQPSLVAEERTISSFGQLAEFYHAVQPSTDTEKALVVSCWMQESEARDGIDSYSVNTSLKHLGYPIGNITRALDALVRQRPALMIQLRKGGTSQQARKLFKVTDAGLKRVEEMLRMSVH